MTTKRKFFGLLRQAEKTNSSLHKAPLATANNKLGEPALLSDKTIPNDTVCVNDTSSSMSWKDCKPSRLEAGKMATEKFISKRTSISKTDRIALVSFDTSAHIVLPFTDITNLTLINSAVTSLKAEGGTDIAEGLKAAAGIFANDPIVNFAGRRLKRILLLTDGCGGRPLKISQALKDADILIEVIGIGGDRSAVNEKLLRKVAKTDANGFTHYWFFTDTDNLVKQYENIATGIVWKGNN